MRFLVSENTPRIFGTVFGKTIEEESRASLSIGRPRDSAEKVRAPLSPTEISRIHLQVRGAFSLKRYDISYYDCIYYRRYMPSLYVFIVSLYENKLAGSRHRVSTVV